MAGSIVKVSTAGGWIAGLLVALSHFQIGIIGGSGLDDPDILQNRREIEVDTPYGKVKSHNYMYFLPLWSYHGAPVSASPVCCQISLYDLMIFPPPPH